MRTWKSRYPSVLSSDEAMITGSKVRLRGKRLEDVQDDYTWQTDTELARLDAARPPTIPFSEYLANYASVLSCPPPAKRQFAIETHDGRHIGNCAYYDINETKGEAELGILIGDRNYWDKGYGRDAVTVLVNHIFLKTDLKRLCLKTLDTNYRARRCFQKCGFTPYGHRLRDGNSFILMELNCKQWQERQTKA